MEGGIVSTFMAITSCESQAYAVKHLASCKWDLERAINVYYNAGPSTSAPAAEEDDDVVRAPVPAPVEALHGDMDDDGGRGGARDAPSIWERSAPPSVPAVPIQIPGEIGTTGWGDAEPADGGEEDPKVNSGMEAQDDEQEDHNIVEEYDYGMEADEDHGSSVDDKEEQKSNGSYKDEDGGSSGGYKDEEDGSSGRAEDEEDGAAAGDKDGGEENASDRDEDDEDYRSEMRDDASYHGSFLDDEYEENDDDYNFGGDMEEEEPRTPPPEKTSSLDEMYRKPYELMFRGSFHGAKVHAARKDQLLLVNLQAGGEFASHLQNRDLWAHEVVRQVVKENFVFLLLEKFDRLYGNDECSKVCSFYKLQDDELPAVLVLDPITGQMLATRCGAIEPDVFMLFIDEYTKSKPSTLSQLKIVQSEAMPESSASAAAAGEQEPAAPDESSASAGAAVEHEPAEPESPASAGAAVDQEPAAPDSSASAGAEVEQEPTVLAECSASTGACDDHEPEPVPMIEEAPAMVVDSDEPMEGEEMYKLRVRFPDGSVVAKEFGCKRRVAALFAFCRSAVDGGGGQTEKKAFRIMRFAGRAFVELQEDGLTFEDLGLKCAAVSVVLSS
ncbi:hypothetical protein ACP70R_027495 [Stipagrostis hirtigluma subsp. patula]